MASALLFSLLQLAAPLAFSTRVTGICCRVGSGSTAVANLLRVCNGRVCFATLAGSQYDVRVEKEVRFERSGVPFGVSCGF